MAFYETQGYLLLTWLFALWQWIRSNKIIVCLIRLTTGLFSQRFSGKGPCIRSGDCVYQILPGINDPRKFENTMSIKGRDNSNPDDTFVFGHRRHGAQFLELRGGRQLLFTEESLLSSIKRLEGCEFVVEHMPVVGNFNTARPIKDEDAIVLLANGHCAVSCAGETLITSSYSEAQRNHVNMSMLATVPLVLQVKGYNFAAAIISIAILVLDLLRTPISRAYARMSDLVLVWVKLNVLRSWSQGYHILSIFSNSWLYSDPVAKCAYKSKGPFYCIYGSLLIKDGFTDCDDEDDDDYLRDLETMFKIEGERAHWLPTPTERSLGEPFLFHNDILVV